MKVIYAEVRNFGSYEHLEFEFQDQGLTLIAGPTGAGKSTLCDIIPWILFGVTAKNGLADDVRSWNATAPTEGRAVVEIVGNNILIQRIRGPKANDLGFSLSPVSDEPLVAKSKEFTRGKDLADTQRLLNQALGFDANTYLSGAYFHEFSQASSFFTASAKVRRVVTEQLVDLIFAKTLTEKASALRKELKTRGTEITDLRKETGIRLENAKVRVKSELRYAEDWVSAQTRRIAEAQTASASFEQTNEKESRTIARQEAAFALDRRKNLIQYDNDIIELRELLKEDLRQDIARLDVCIASLGDTKCGTCGASKHSTERLTLTKQRHDLALRQSTQSNNKRAIANIENMIRLEQAKINPYTKQLEILKDRTNTYDTQIQNLQAELNPFIATSEQAKIIRDALVEDYESLCHMYDEWKQESEDIELLTSALETFRTAIVKSAISDLEYKTNDLLTKHFDAEIRVVFDAKDADKLEATITKDGNECSYPQLSKGQRQLLKLCFGVAVMRIVSNHNAVKFDAIFLDEFVDGCDDETKAKAFGLLQALALDYGSVFAIDHSEGLKAMFTKRYDVSLINGKSLIEEAK